MPIRYLLFFILCITTAPIFSQDYVTRKDASSKALKYFDEARSMLNRGNYSGAIELLEKAQKKEPTFIDAILMQADVQLQTGDYNASEANFEKALALSPDYSPLVYFLLAEAEKSLQKYEEAATHYETYLATGKLRPQRKETAQKSLLDVQFAGEAIKQPVPFQPESLGETVNTELPEYLPSLTADGEFLVYTTRVGPKNEDIFYSERTDTAWTKGKALPSFNTPFNESSPSISANGKTLVYASNQRQGNFDLYYAEFTGKNWTEPQLLPSPVNTNSWESQACLSADGQRIYFVSDRGGGQGQLDIWQCEKLADGKWGNVSNLGEQINTPYNEQAPFIHPDGKTLYFMSKGHPGMGEYDLFLSKMDENGNWGTPINLGYPINTPNNEGAIIVSLDGQTAYFDTDKYGPTGQYQEMGNADLFSFDLYPAIQPSPCTYVKANVIDAVTRKPVVAKVSFLRLKDEEVHLSAQTDKKGLFFGVLPLGENYALNVSKTGYLFYSEHFALEEANTYSDPYILDIYLVPIPEKSTDEPAKAVVLNNVFFETGSAALLPISITELTALKRLLEENPDLKIQINGHTDNVGSEDDNLQLSNARAKAVHDFLIAEGIAPERLRYKGFGESQPIESNDTPEGRKLNRRTEFEAFN
jgi:outer membrane protein OmpA-like peptidoglycan-associated protein/tetratricopeptide (TPR) repeat protein